MKLYFRDSAYEGETKQMPNSDKYYMHGAGFLKYDNGDYYIGLFYEGKKNGYGEYFYSNGDWYKGNWVEDKKHGLGFYYQKPENYGKPRLYSGHFYCDYPLGNNLISYEDGTIAIANMVYFTLKDEVPHYYPNGEKIIKKYGKYMFETYSGPPEKYDREEFIEFVKNYNKHIISENFSNLYAAKITLDEMNSPKRIIHPLQDTALTKITKLPSSIPNDFRLAQQDRSQLSDKTSLEQHILKEKRTQNELERQSLLQKALEQKLREYLEESNLKNIPKNWPVIKITGHAGTIDCFVQHWRAAVES